MEEDKKFQKILIKLGINIRIYRKRMKLTEDELSKLTKIDRSYLSDIEKGKENPTIKIIKKIADALHVKVRDLFHDELMF